MPRDLSIHHIIIGLVCHAKYHSIPDGKCNGISYTALQYALRGDWNSWSNSMEIIQGAYQAYAKTIPETDVKAYEAKHGVKLHEGTDFTGVWLRLCCLRKADCPEPYRGLFNWDEDCVSALKNLRIESLIENIATYQEPSIFQAIDSRFRSQLDCAALIGHKEVTPPRLQCKLIANEANFYTEVAFDDFLRKAAAVASQYDLRRIGFVIDTPANHSVMVCIKISKRNGATMYMALPNTKISHECSSISEATESIFYEQNKRFGPLWIRWQLYALNSKCKRLDSTALKQSLMGESDDRYLQAATIEKHRKKRSAGLSTTWLHIVAIHNELYPDYHQFIDEEIVNQRDSSKNLPLHYALEHIDESLALHLTEQTRVDELNTPNIRGNTAFLKSLIQRRYTVSQRLLREADLNIDTPNRLGESALDYLPTAPSRVIESYLSHPSTQKSSQQTFSSILIRITTSLGTIEAARILRLKPSVDFLASGTPEAIDTFQHFTNRADFLHLMDRVKLVLLNPNITIEKLNPLYYLYRKGYKELFYFWLSMDPKNLLSPCSVEDKDSRTVLDAILQSDRAFFLRDLFKGNSIPTNHHAEWEAVKSALSLDRFFLVKFWFHDRSSIFSSNERCQSVLQAFGIYDFLTIKKRQNYLFTCPENDKGSGIITHCIEKCLSSSQQASAFMRTLRSTFTRISNALTLEAICDFHRIALRLPEHLEPYKQQIVSDLSHLLEMDCYRESSYLDVALGEKLSIHRIRELSEIYPMITAGSSTIRWRNIALNDDFYGKFQAVISTEGSWEFLLSDDGHRLCKEICEQFSVGYYIDKYPQFGAALLEFESGSQSIVIDFLQRKEFGLAGSLIRSLCPNADPHTLEFFLAASIFMNDTECLQGIIDLPSYKGIYSELRDTARHILVNQYDGRSFARSLRPSFSEETMAAVCRTVPVYPNLLSIIILLARDNDWCIADNTLKSVPWAAIRFTYSLSRSYIYSALSKDEVSRPAYGCTNKSLAMYACKSDNLALLKHLLTEFPERDLHEGTHPILFFASKHGSEDVLDLLIESNLFDINGYYDHQSLLERFAHAGLDRAVAALLEDKRLDLRKYPRSASRAAAELYTRRSDLIEKLNAIGVAQGLTLNPVNPSVSKKRRVEPGFY